MLSLGAHGGFLLHQHSSRYNKKNEGFKEKYLNSLATLKAEHLPRGP